MNNSQVFTEVYEILNILGKEYIDKLPQKLYSYIEDVRDKNSIIEFDINKTPAEQDISEDASYIITYLNLEYWCSKEEKDVLINQYIKNDETFYEEMRKKYNPDEIFPKRENKVKEELPVNIKKKENILNKILYKIFDILKVKRNK